MKYKNKMMMLLVLLLASINYSCKKYLDIPAPKDKATPDEIFENDASATSAITGVYSRMQSISGGYSGSQNSISIAAGLSADEFKSHNVTLNVFLENEIPTSNLIINNYIWSESYRYIYTANAILDGLQSSSTISSDTKKQLLGEAKFIRAFCYFYLVNLFGEVPLNLTSDLQSSRFNSKSSVENIYAQIISDLIDAENNLSPNYISTERIRPNRWAATALLSRVYLYTGQWDLALQKATAVISQNATYSLNTNLDQVFLKNSAETIWQLMPPAGRNTWEGTTLILTAPPIYVSLSEKILPLFDSGDERKTKWLKQFTNATGTYYYPYKYKTQSTTNGVISEYSMVIRLAEMFLIRAEANAQLNNTTMALDDINLIRKRAGLTTPLAGLDPTQCLTEVAKQRQLELFSEWGHRWLDLKRTGKASTVLAPIKIATWKDTDVLYPIPDAEINANYNIKQNFGY